MTITAQSIVLEVQTTLQDLTGTRWPASELVRYINEAQRELTTKRPDAVATQITLTCVEGAKQALPSTAQTLIDVAGNATGTKRAVTKVDRVLLEAQSRDWMSATPATPTLHFMHTLAESRAIYVYPPAVAGNVLELVVAPYPTDISAPTSPGKLFSTVAGSLSIPDEWAGFVRNFCLFRAYSKDAEFGGNAQLAANYLGLAKADLGEQLQSSASVAPKE